jgi:uncharacterized Zn finger protein (UPF0148 family)
VWVLAVAAVVAMHFLIIWRDNDDKDAGPGLWVLSLPCALVIYWIWTDGYWVTWFWTHMAIGTVLCVTGFGGKKKTGSAPGDGAPQVAAPAPKRRRARVGNAPHVAAPAPKQGKAHAGKAAAGSLCPRCGLSSLIDHEGKLWCASCGDFIDAAAGSLCPRCTRSPLIEHEGRLWCARCADFVDGSQGAPSAPTAKAAPTPAPKQARPAAVNAAAGSLCPRCKLSPTIDHEGRLWCARCADFVGGPKPNAAPAPALKKGKAAAVGQATAALLREIFSRANSIKELGDALSFYGISAHQRGESVVFERNGQPYRLAKGLEVDYLRMVGRLVGSVPDATDNVEYAPGATGSKPAQTPPPAVPRPPVCVALKGLQQVVDAVPAGQMCELGSGEYQAPCTISKPLTLRGHDAKRASIVGDGRTAVKVAADGVTLSGVYIEAGDGALAIEKPAELAVGLANVVVRGRTSGFGDEDKEWGLPASVDVSAGGSFRISVPVGVRVVSKVDAIGLPNAEYPPGEHEIAMDLSEMGKGALVFGYFHVVSPSFIRRIHVTGRIARDG